MVTLTRRPVETNGRWKLNANMVNLTQVTRLADRYMSIHKPTGTVFLMTQAEYNALASHNADAPPLPPSGWTQRDWVDAWHSNEVIAWGGVLTTDAPTSGFRDGDYYENSSDNTIRIRFRHNDIRYTLTDEIINFTLTGGDITTYTGNGVSITNNVLTVVDEDALIGGRT